MGKFLDYNSYAPKYAYTRQAVDWILDPLISEVKTLQHNSTILEIGCGTGNYIISLSKKLLSYNYNAFDISKGMLDVARSRSNTVTFIHGNADTNFPFKPGTIDMAFAVDVIHHITSLRNFFNEASRVLLKGKKLVLVTDSRKNIRKRSLTKYFPEALKIEFERYPKISELNYYARLSGLKLIDSYLAEGTFDIDDLLISRFEEKCSSSTRLMSDKAHKKGIERLKVAQTKGKKWLSSYTILKYLKTE